MNLFLKIFLLPLAILVSGEKPLVVGTTSGYAPYVSLNDRGEYEGFDIDLAKELAKKLNKPLEIKDFGNMPGLMLALKQGKADLLIWAISITEERKKGMEMIYYQGERVAEMPVVFWKKIPEEIRTLEDLKNCSVSVEAGSYQESVLKRVPDIELKYLDSLNGAVMDLKYGKSLATCMDPPLLPRFQKQFTELKTLFLPLPPEERSEGNGLCIQKSNQPLASQVRQAIEELRAEGKILELEKKWGLVQ